MPDDEVLRKVEELFPNGKGEIVITSPKDDNYNCIAWAADDNQKFWWPIYPGFWPASVTRETTLSAFRQAYSLSGYEECGDGLFEEEFEKIAIYADQAQAPTHAARQLNDGKWTSKLGPQWDISHDSVSSVEGVHYGQATVFMKRPRKKQR